MTVLKGGVSYTEGEIEYVWHSTDSACEKCQELNNKVFNSIDEISDKPHPNCRCWVEDRKKNEECNCKQEAQNIMDNANELQGDVLSELEEMDMLFSDLRNDISIIDSLKEEIEKIVENIKRIKSDFEYIKHEKPGIQETVRIIAQYWETSRQTYAIFEQHMANMIASKEHIDKYHHANANCDAAELSNMHAAWAVIFSIGKEFADYRKKVYEEHRDKKEVLKDCMQDIRADLWGLSKAYEEGLCSEKVLEVEEEFLRDPNSF